MLTDLWNQQNIENIGIMIIKRRLTTYKQKNLLINFNERSGGKRKGRS